MRNRSAFTLFELLVTASIMSMLAIAATSGYHAIVRGMNERGVLAAASSVMRAASARAQVDRRHAAVFCYNRLLKQPSEDGTEPGVAAGVLVGVRFYGRLSAVRGNFLYDEFADIDQCFETLSEQGALAKRRGFRLYRMNNKVSKMEYSVVADATWYADEEAEESAERLYLPSLGVTTNAEMAAYYQIGGNASWKAGDGYGFEFLETQLPDNYIIDADIPSSVDRMGAVKVIDFSPDSVGAGEGVEIRIAVPDGNGRPQPGKKLGKATASEGDTV